MGYHVLLMVHFTHKSLQAAFILKCVKVRIARAKYAERNISLLPEL